MGASPGWQLCPLSLGRAVLGASPGWQLCPLSLGRAVLGASHAPARHLDRGLRSWEDLGWLAVCCQEVWAERGRPHDGGGEGLVGKTRFGCFPGVRVHPGTGGHEWWVRKGREAAQRAKSAQRGACRRVLAGKSPGRPHGWLSQGGWAGSRGSRPAWWGMGRGPLLLRVHWGLAAEAPSPVFRWGMGARKHLGDSFTHGVLAATDRGSCPQPL